MKAEEPDYLIFVIFGADRYQWETGLKSVKYKSTNEF